MTLKEHRHSCFNSQNKSRSSALILFVSPKQVPLSLLSSLHVSIFLPLYYLLSCFVLVLLKSFGNYFYRLVKSSCDMKLDRKHKARHFCQTCKNISEVLKSSQIGPWACLLYLFFALVVDVLC